MTFHARNRIPIEDVRRGKRKADSQSILILQFFRSHPKDEYTPWQVQTQMLNRGTAMLITSVRRAMSDLEKQGLLDKCIEHQVRERYGMSNCKWRLTQKRLNEQLTLL